MAVVAHANQYNFRVAFFVALGSFTYGYNSAVTASVIGLPSFFSYMKIDPTTSHGSSIEGAINGVYLAGATIGCWVLALIADRLGRVKSIQLIAAVCVISAALQAGSAHVAMFLVGRLLNGFGVGLLNCIIPIYQSEISPASQRGRLVGAHGTLIVSGYACAGWTSVGAQYATNHRLQWRLPLALQMLAPLILLCGSPWLPESPRWLISSQRDEQAKVVLENLHRTPADPTASAAHGEYHAIRQQVELEAQDTVKHMWQCLQRPTIRKRMFLTFGLEWLLASTGALVLSNYAVTLYGDLGLSGTTILIILASYNTMSAVNNFINSLLLDRLGRKLILSIGVIGMIVAVTIYTALVAKYTGSSNKVAQGAAVAMQFLTGIFYGGCLDASSYVYISEVFPTAVRAHGVGFAISGLFMSNLLYLQVAPTAFRTIGWKYLLVFIIVPVAMLYPFLKYLPETRQLSLEEIAGTFGDPVAPITPASELAELKSAAQELEKPAESNV